MRVAWRELVRQPGRFLTAGGALTLIVVLLLILGGILDALTSSTTGLLRAQSAPLIAFGANSRDSLVRSRIPPEVRDAVATLPGVDEVTGLGVSLLGAAVPGGSEVADVAVIGYEAPNARVPAPPAPGEAYADASLEDEGVAIGQTLRVGATEVPVEVVGWVEDTNYNLQGGVWVAAETWREILDANIPNAALSEGTFQAIVVTPEAGTGVTALARRIDEAVPEVRTLTIDEAIAALPGVSQQQSVFGAVIGVTFTVAGLVVALFFALITIERIGLLGMLKAVGASSLTLAIGLTLQAILIAAGSIVVGGCATLGLASVIPDTVPLEVGAGRFVLTSVGLVLTALLGSAISFRRVIRIDPASAVGGA